MTCALAWGPEAHERVAERAEAALSPEARAQLRTITSHSLPELSTEPDRWRKSLTGSWSAPLHFANPPLDAQTFELDAHCEDHLCGPAAVAHFSHRLVEGPDREEALAMVVHLVADLHQPLHVAYSEDRGGNRLAVLFEGHRTDLHHLWDDDLPALASELSPLPVGSRTPNPELWAQESFALTRTLVYATPPGAAVGADYLERAVPVVAQRLELASMRLTALLEHALVDQALPFPDPLQGGTYSRQPLSDQALRVVLAALALALALVVFVVRRRGRQRPGPGQAARELRAHARLLAVGAVATLASVAVDVSLPVVYRYAFDEVVPSPTGGEIQLLTGVALLLVLVSSLSWLVAAGTVARLNAALLASLRERMLARMGRASVEALKARPSSEVMAWFQSDLHQVETLLLRDLHRGFRYVVLTLGVMLVMLYLDWRLTAAVTVLVPLAGWLPQLFARQGLGLTRERHRREEDALALVHELLQTLPTQRAFGLEGMWRKRFVERSRALARVARRQGWFTMMIPGMSSVSMLAMSLVILMLGTVMATRGELSLGSLAALFAALTLLASSLARIGSVTPAVVAALGAYSRLRQALDLPEEESRGQGPTGPVALKDALRLEDVTFGYQAGHPQLHGLTLELRAGRSTAVVGPSGSGKSTLIWLLQRHAKADQGRMLWDGSPLEPGHRASMGLVGQDSVLFAGTLRDNIRLGRAEATDEEVEQAARQAALHGFIVSLPLGYETEVGPGHGSLSGGQRQRVALARALVRRPALLVLDEATSALDPATAAHINGTLRSLRGQTTVLCVTHDLDAVRDYDHIIVLDQGRVVGQGSHDTLWTTCPLYKALVQHRSGIVVHPERAEVSAERLARVPLFQGLPSTVLNELARQARTERFEDGEDIVRQGDPGDRMFLVAHGRVMVLADRNGEPRQLDESAVGDHLGEIALLYERPRTATLRARGHCVLLSFSRDAVLALFARQPGLERAFRLSAERRLALTAERLERGVGYVSTQRQLARPPS